MSITERNRPVRRKPGRPKLPYREDLRQASIRRGQKAIKDATSSAIVKSTTRDAQAAIFHALGFPQSEIAAILGVSPQTANQRINRGLAITGVFDHIATTTIHLHRIAPKNVAIIESLIDRLAKDLTDDAIPIDSKSLDWFVKLSNMVLNYTIGHQQKRVQLAESSRTTAGMAAAAAVAAIQAADKLPDDPIELTAQLERVSSALNRSLERLRGDKGAIQAEFTVDQDSGEQPAGKPCLPAPADLPAETSMGDTGRPKKEKGPSNQRVTDV